MTIFDIYAPQKGGAAPRVVATISWEGGKSQVLSDVPEIARVLKRKLAEPRDTIVGRPAYAMASARGAKRLIDLPRAGRLITAEPGTLIHFRAVARSYPREIGLVSRERGETPPPASSERVKAAVAAGAPADQDIEDIEPDA